jgi:hypothetical protein
MLREGLNLSEIANLIVISLNGAAPLYAASKDPAVWKQTASQLHVYITHLRKKVNTTGQVPSRGTDH